MKIRSISTSGAGTWSRDCELLHFSLGRGFEIIYHRDEDDTYWSLQSECIVASKIINHEFSTVGYLEKLPLDGAFYEIVDSPWVEEFKEFHTPILSKCKHYVFQFYDETVEVIAQNFIFKQLKEKPRNLDHYSFKQ